MALELSAPSRGEAGRHALIGAIRLGRIPCLMTNRGSVNGMIFLRFVRRHLLRTLRPGDVVNLNFPKMRVVRDAIEAVGATPLCLPTYRPELNPIELWWGDVKRHLRRLRIDARDSLERAVRGLRARLSPRQERRLVSLLAQESSRQVLCVSSAGGQRSLRARDSRRTRMQNAARSPNALVRPERRRASVDTYAVVPARHVRHVRSCRKKRSRRSAFGRSRLGPPWRSDGPYRGDGGHGGSASSLTA